MLKLFWGHRIEACAICWSRRKPSLSQSHQNVMTSPRPVSQATCLLHTQVEGRSFPTGHSPLCGARFFGWHLLSCSMAGMRSHLAQGRMQHPTQMNPCPHTGNGQHLWAIWALRFSRCSWPLAYYPASLFLRVPGGLTSCCHGTGPSKCLLLGFYTACAQ